MQKTVLGREKSRTSAKLTPEPQPVSSRRLVTAERALQSCPDWGKRTKPLYPCVDRSWDASAGCSRVGA